MLAFGDRPGGYALIQRFSKINISLIIESIAQNSKGLFYLV